MTPYYEDDAVTIYHGDCREVLATITGVHVTVTSPPYNTLGARIPSNPTGQHANNGWMAKVAKFGYVDDMPESEYVAWQVDIAGLIASSTVPRS